MKRKQLTRKRRALRWLAAFCLLLLLCGAGGTYGLSRESVLRKQERYFFIDPTAQWASIRDRYERIAGKGYVLASANEDVLMLGLARWTPWHGWQPGFAWPVERKGAVVDAMYAWYSWDPENGVYPFVVFGAVNDPRVEQITLTFQDWETAERKTAEVSVDVGQPYFTETIETANICRVHLTARNGMGTVIFEEYLQDGISLGDYDWEM